MFCDAKAVENNFSRWALTVTGVSIVLVRPHNERPTRDIDEIAVVRAARAEFSLFLPYFDVRKSSLRRAWGHSMASMLTHFCLTPFKPYL